MPKAFRSAIAFFFVSVWISGGHALADTIGLVANVGYQANTPADGEYLNISENFPLTLSPIIVTPFSGSSSGASASASGSVTFGSITGEATASATSGGSAAAASFQGVWLDSILVTSSTLAPGTPVRLLFTTALSGSLACTGTSPNGSANGEIQAGFSTSAGYDISESVIACGFSLPANHALLVSAFVGEDIAVEGSLLEEVFAGDLTAPSAATADPPTAQFFIDSETPGASYTTGSGNTYFTPAAGTTPEAPSLLLLATGVFAGAIGLRLRRSRPDCRTS